MAVFKTARTAKPNPAFNHDTAHRAGLVWSIQFAPCGLTLALGALNMGQVHVDSIPTTRFAEVLDAFEKAGFEVISEQVDEVGMGEFVCRRGHSQIPFSTYIDKKRPEDTFVIVALPPQTLLPWRWPADYRLFGDMLTILDRYDHPYTPA